MALIISFQYQQPSIVLNKTNLTRTKSTTRRLQFRFEHLAAISSFITLHTNLSRLLIPSNETMSDAAYPPAMCQGLGEDPPTEDNNVYKGYVRIQHFEADKITIAYTDKQTGQEKLVKSEKKQLKADIKDYKRPGIGVLFHLLDDGLKDHEGGLIARNVRIDPDDKAPKTFPSVQQA